MDFLLMFLFTIFLNPRAQRYSLDLFNTKIHFVQKKNCSIQSQMNHKKSLYLIYQTQP